MASVECGAVPSWLVYVTSWMAVSVGMILFNKAVLSVVGFPFPMLLTAWHMVVATAATQALVRSPATAHLLPAVQNSTMTLDLYLTKIVPIAFAFAASLICSNSAYVLLSVSFVQILKATTPVIVLLVSFALGLEKWSAVYLQIICLICGGVAMASSAELQWNTLGVIFQAMACVCEGARLVLTNTILRDLKLDALSYLYYTAPLCGFVIGVICYVVEGPSITPQHLAQVFPFILIANGAVAFSLNLAGVLLIKNTTALTLTLAGIVKDILLCFFSFTLFGAPISTLQILGYTIAVIGLNAYKEYRRHPTRFDDEGLVAALWLVLTGRIEVPTNTDNSMLPVSSNPLQQLRVKK